MIPIIDLNNRTILTSEVNLAETFDSAMRQHGFCYLTNHGIPLHLIHEAQQLALQFFQLPNEVKLRYQIANSVRHSGYVPFSEKGVASDELTRLYEAYDIGLELPATDADFLAGNIFYGPNTWPDLPLFRSAVYAYYAAVQQLAIFLTNVIEEALGLASGSLNDMMSKPTAQLRLIHYPENNTRNSPSGDNHMMGAHTDYEFFTLLYQTAPGLQTVDVRGKWVDVPPIADTLVLNVGDMAEIISGGRYRSNPHRVLNNGTERFSMPYFASFNYHTLVRPMIATEKEYLPVIAGDHLLQQVTQDFSYLRMRTKDSVPLLVEPPVISNPFCEGKSE